MTTNGHLHQHRAFCGFKMAEFQSDLTTDSKSIRVLHKILRWTWTNERPANWSRWEVIWLDCPQELHNRLTIHVWTTSFRDDDRTRSSRELIQTAAINAKKSDIKWNAHLNKIVVNCTVLCNAFMLYVWRSSVTIVIATACGTVHRLQPPPMRRFGCVLVLKM